MTTEIVVASYKETLDWVHILNCINSRMGKLPECRFTIYRTGDPMEGAIMLENKGREAGQWLAHIVDRYDSLSDVTFFVQADLGPSFGRPTRDWPHDLNSLKSFHLPPQPDAFSFYLWPNFDRIRCIVGEPNMTEDAAVGHPPADPVQLRDAEQVGRLWGKTPEMVRLVKIHSTAFFGAQHVLTKEFIRRIPRSHYEKCLKAVREHELAHWLEFGNWPVFIYDIYRQGPLG